MTQTTEFKSHMEDVLTSGGGSEEWQAFLIESLKGMSEPLARKMLAQIGLDGTTTTPFTLVENGCGMGAVAPVLQETVHNDVLAKSSILCGDYSEALVGVVKKRIEKEGWVNTEAKFLDAQDTGLPSNSYTHVVSNIVFHTIPDSQAALKDSIRLLQADGTLAFTTWHEDGVGWQPDIQAAFAAFPFQAPCILPKQITAWGKWSDVNWVRQTLLAYGLTDVKVDVLAHVTEIQSPDHFLKTYDTMIDWAVRANFDEEMLKKCSAEEAKKMIKMYLQDAYGDQPWLHTWVSIIATGKKPL